MCLDDDPTTRLTKEFGVRTRPVEWRGTDKGPVHQVVIETSSEAWFDVEELRRAGEKAHGVQGADCAECGRWKWISLPLDEVPPVRKSLDLGDVPFAASPEWFGDGGMAYQEHLVREDVARVIAEARPRDFTLRDG